MKKRLCGVLCQHAWELPAPEEGAALCQEALLQQLRALVQNERLDGFCLCVERGLPLDLGDALLSLKQELPLTLECFIPYEEQHIDWPEAERTRYFNLLARCDREHMLASHFSLLCYREAFRAVLAGSDYHLLLWDGAASEEADSAAQLKARGSSAQVIAPASLYQRT